LPSTDEERLVVAIEARIRDFEKNMLKAERTGTQSYQGLRRGSKTATQQMEQDMVRSTTRINQALATTSLKIGEFGRAFVGGLVGGLAAGGIAGIISQVREVALSVAEVGDQAKIAGVNVKSFQELKFVAEQNRISVDALTDGLKEMNLRADEFILTGAGSGAEAFTRLGLNADTLREKLKNPSELFTEIIGKLSQLDRAAQIRISDEIFGGTGGEVFVKLIDQGEKGIRDTIKAGNDLGVVMDEQLIKKAAEVDRRFNQVSSTVGTGLKTAIVEAASALQGFIDTFQGFYKEYEARRNLAEAGSAVGGMFGSKGDITPASSRPADPKGPRLPSAADILRQKLIQQRVQDAFDAPAGSPIAPSKSGSKSSTKSIDHERQAVTDLISELEEELSLVNATDTAKRSAAAARQAGAAATDQERQKVINLTEAIHQEEEARTKAEAAMQAQRDLARAAIDDVWSGIEQNKSAFEILGDVAVNSLKRISDTMIDDLLDSIFQVNKAASGSGGSGILGSLFGSLFGGGSGGFAALPAVGPVPTMRPYAKGGVANSPSIFAEAGPEAAVPLPDGRRIPVDLRGAGGRPGVDVQVGVTVDDDGNLQAYVKRTSETAASGAVKAYDRDSYSRTINHVRKGKNAMDLK
jgi:hypothetical protein